MRTRRLWGGGRLMASKKCTRCEVVKDLSNFQRNRGRKDGRRSECKTCANMDARRRHKEHPAGGRAKSRRWYQNNPDAVARQYKRGLESGYTAAAAAKQRAKFPEKIAARDAVTTAIRRGELERGSCETCGECSGVEAHHDSYAKKHRLKVRWLCTRCHRDHHILERAS